MRFLLEDFYFDLQTVLSGYEDSDCLSVVRKQGQTETLLRLNTTEESATTTDIAESSLQ